MVVFLECQRLHKMAETNYIQVYKTFTVGYISAHIFIQKRFNKFNQLDTSMMDAIDERLEGIVPSHDTNNQ